MVPDGSLPTREPLHQLRPKHWLPWRPAIIAWRGNRVEAAGFVRLRLVLSTFFGNLAANNRIIAEPGFRNRGLHIRIRGRGNTVRFGTGVRWGGEIMVNGNQLTVSIGARSDAKNARLIANGADIEIGADCLLAQDIEIRSSDMHRIANRADGAVINPPAAVQIGNHIWIAGRVFIGKGVQIADGCVVGAGSIVTRSVEEPDCIVAGNPARIVRREIVWKR